MGGGLLLGLSAGILLSAGGLLAAVLQLESIVRYLLAANVVFWSVLVVGAAALSVPAWLSPWSLLAWAVLILAIAVCVWVTTGRPRPPLRSTSLLAGSAARDPVVRVLAAVVLVSMVYVLALALLTTPNDWDGLTYHLTRALLWDQQHGIGYVPAGNEPRLNGNPPVAEIGLYFVTLTARSERFAALPQYVALWACVLAVMVIARRIGLSRAQAVYGGLVFATLPLVVLQGSAILTDLVVASFLLTAVAFLLGRTRADLLLGALAVSLAIGTKFSAILALPVVVLVVFSAAPRLSWPRTGAALVAGAVAGSPWYILNLVETGSLDGDLSESTGQGAEHSVAAMMGTFRALVFDVLDLSGFWGADVYLAWAVGAGLIVGAVVARRRGQSHETHRALLYAGALTAVAPFLVLALEWSARSGWQRLWFNLGREDIALAHGTAWKVLRVPDTSQSWFGVAGAIVIIGGVGFAIAGARRGLVPLVSLVLALSPLLLIAIFSLTIVYDPFRGRLLIAGVGLACAAWGATLRVRWLSNGIAALCITTMALSLVNSYTKPSGLRLVAHPIDSSVWHDDRIETLTVIRGYEGTPELLRAVELKVPPRAEVAVAAPVDSFLAPLAGPGLSRTLRLVADGDTTPPTADWLVANDNVSTTGCPRSWITDFEGEDDWRLLKRVAPDGCNGIFEPL